MGRNRYELESLAKELLIEKGLQSGFSNEIDRQLSALHAPAAITGSQTKDLRHLLWSSIDNEDSRDLDQVTYAEGNSLWIGIADVQALIEKASPIDDRAELNTTSIYTPAKMFPMLPEKVSADLTSLNEKEDRLAIVIHLTINNEGKVLDHEIFPALIHNYAKLTYDSVGKWLENKGGIPQKIKEFPELGPVLHAQFKLSHSLRKRRRSLGALSLQTSELEAKLNENDQVVVKEKPTDAARELIENFMIAANYVVASHMEHLNIPSLRRVVVVPKRWDRIREIAKDKGFTLPQSPDSEALEDFLELQREKDPENYPELSLSIVKLLGRGEYILDDYSTPSTGHFGLALSDYTHSTAPNRRFPDLIIQRQLKAFLNHQKQPYTLEELKRLAVHCTHQEDVVMKIERHLNKSAAALSLKNQIGNTYSAIVTGASRKGTWVKIFNPPIEGKVLEGYEGLDVGDKVKVKLINTNISKGFIDFIVV